MNFGISGSISRFQNADPLHLDLIQETGIQFGLERFDLISMPSEVGRYAKFGGVTLVILVALSYLAYTGVQDSKSYYVTISELHKMGNTAYSKRLRVAGNVQPGSIKRTGTHVHFNLMEQEQLLSVDYSGTEAPPDTFKDDSQA